MTPTRAAALLALAALAGCSKPPRPKGTDDPAAARPADPAVPAGTPAPTGDPVADAKGFAQAFLKAVQDGTATPAMLTPEFKKVIAEPVFADDVAKGYSDDAAGQWLARFKGGPAVELGPAAPVGGAVLFIAGAAGPPRAHVCLRVVRVGGGHATDWYFRANVDPAMTALAQGDAAAAGFAAAAFLDALLAKDDRLAEGLLTPRLKAALAPPLPSDNRGYNRGLLAGKLADVRGPFPGYALNPPAAGTVSGALRKGEAQKPVTLTLVKGDRPWDWLVDGVKAE